MNEMMIKNWNDLVAPGDQVFHLGDLGMTWGNDCREKVDGILMRLNGCKTLIKGNHDRREVYKSSKWHAVYDYHELKIDFGDKKKQKIALFHYPVISWNALARGSWMLHGHCHGNLPQPLGKIMDVGVDRHKYKPIHIDDVKSWMDHREIHLPGDHHGSKKGKK